MAKAPKIYTRLSRSPVAIGAYHSLWQGEGHVLQVTSNGYTESYQRFDYRDIEGFVITPSNRRFAWLVVWGMLTIFAGIGLVAAMVTDSTPVVAICFLVPCALGMLWNWLLGPTVRVQVLTRVGLMGLRSLVRHRKALRVLGRLQPLIEDAQRSPTPVAPPAKSTTT